MKTRPIIMSGDSVRAILAGRKSQTRRVLNPQPPEGARPIAVGWYTPSVVDQRGELAPGPARHGVYGEEWDARCTYGAPGGLLYVKEAFARVDEQSAASPVVYRATDTDHPMMPSNPRWRSPLYMPRCANRLMLRVTSVRVECVQDISEEDAWAEGMRRAGFGGWTDGTTGYDTITARQAFRELWESINDSKPGRAWVDNPWVWVVDFEVVSKEGQST